MSYIIEYISRIIKATDCKNARWKPEIKFISLIFAWITSRAIRLLQAPLYDCPSSATNQFVQCHMLRGYYNIGNWKALNLWCRQSSYWCFGNHQVVLGCIKVSTVLPSAICKLCLCGFRKGELTWFSLFFNDYSTVDFVFFCLILFS
jgi:hypothetical protein